MDDNDAARHEMRHVLALVQEQLQELSTIEQKRSAIEATGTAADGLVEVTVNAQRLVTSTVIDEAYLEDFEFAELGGHITTAAQKAGEEVERRSAALLGPMSRRREEITSLGGASGAIPDFQELLSGLRSAVPAELSPQTGDGGSTGWDEGSSFPTVRR
jgi:DNA-binding protein YbaB